MACSLLPGHAVAEGEVITEPAEVWQDKEVNKEEE
jgi:hypothetical protein